MPASVCPVSKWMAVLNSYAELREYFKGGLKSSR